MEARRLSSSRTLAADAAASLDVRSLRLQYMATRSSDLCSSVLDCTVVPVQSNSTPLPNQLNTTTFRPDSPRSRVRSARPAMLGKDSNTSTTPANPTPPRPVVTSQATVRSETTEQPPIERTNSLQTQESSKPASCACPPPNTQTPLATPPPPPRATPPSPQQNAANTPVMPLLGHPVYKALGVIRGESLPFQLVQTHIPHFQKAHLGLACKPLRT